MHFDLPGLREKIEALEAKAAVPDFWDDRDAAQAVLRALKTEIPVAGLTKDDRHRTRALIFEEREYPLKGNSELFAYLGAIQEEVHRFAIDYHHRLRGKQMTRSVLDLIPGIGEKRKMALLSHFGSVDAIKAAGVEALSEAPGMNMKAAESVHEYFAGKERTDEAPGPEAPDEAAGQADKDGSPVPAVSDEAHGQENKEQ